MLPQALLPLTLLLAASFLISLLLTDRLRKYLVLDRPNARSMHDTPVPRGGGWAVVGTILVGWVAVVFMGDSKLHDWPFLGLVLLIIVSWQDDKHDLNPLIRLATHLLAAFLGSLCFASDQTLFAGHLPFWLDRAIMILGWAWFMNLYNFMDGIDGISGCQTIILAAGCAILFWLTGLGDFFFYGLAALLVGSSLGFLWYNWHPAKIFLGDVGSVPLGYLTGYLLLTLAMIEPAAALILPLYYLADSGITLTKRLLRGEKIWQPHRQHFYQGAAQKLGRHDIVVLWIVIADLLLLAAAGAALYAPLPALALAFVIVALLLRKMHKSAA